MAEHIKCETCLYNKNCQFLAKHRNTIVKDCSAYKNAADVVEVVHGEWVKNEEESQKHIEAIYFCSACQNWEAWGETEKYNYCPNCGAKMDGDKNG